MGKDEKTFGERLREARIQARLSQSELEERSGIPKARLSRYENGHVIPSIQTLERLASSLGVSEASLLGEQRAYMEDFYSTLAARGVRLASREQGIKLANAIADTLQSLGLVEDETILLPETEDQAPTSAVPAWVGSEAPGEDGSG